MAITKIGRFIQDQNGILSMNTIQKLTHAMHWNNLPEVVNLVNEKMESRDELTEIRPILNAYINLSLSTEKTNADSGNTDFIKQIREVYLSMIKRMHELSEKAVMEVDWKIHTSPSSGP
jgi:hypothetical protein